jgi:PKD repeat protein
MTIEKTKATDIVSSGLTCNTKAGEAAQATGKYHVECRDKDGNLKWTAESKNLVVNVGLQYMAGSALTSVSQITTWYLGLYGAGASNTPSASDTMSSHGAAGSGGWTEIVPYSNANRVTASFATATTANPSVVTNTASPAVFNINATATVGGAFLTSSNTKSGTTGTLFSAADFGSPGDRSVVSGDSLSVTYTFSLAA